MALPTLDSTALIEYLRRAQQIIIMTHVLPDSDAVGSLLGLTHALRTLGKRVTPACSDALRDRFDILPGNTEVVTQATGSFDLALALDCGDESRLGSVWTNLPEPRPILVNIDHHISNTHFGEINWIDPAAVSTAELVLQLIDRLCIALNRDIASCVLYGIVGDTLGFRTPNTTPQTLRYAQRLMEAGASLNECMDHQFNRHSRALVCLWGKAISGMKIDHRIAYTAISKTMRDACGMSTADLGLSSFLVSITEVDRAAVLVENDQGQVEISLRAKQGHNVSNAAVALGGGGHPLAAGATIDGPLEIATPRVMQALLQNS